MNIDLLIDNNIDYEIINDNINSLFEIGNGSSSKIINYYDYVLQIPHNSELLKPNNVIKYIQLLQDLNKLKTCDNKNVTTPFINIVLFNRFYNKTKKTYLYGFKFKKYKSDLKYYLKILTNKYEYAEGYDLFSLINIYKNIESILLELFNILLSKYKCYDIKSENILVNYNDNLEICDIVLHDFDLLWCKDINSNNVDPKYYLSFYKIILNIMCKFKHIKNNINYGLFNSTIIYDLQNINNFINEYNHTLVIGGMLFFFKFYLNKYLKNINKDNILTGGEYYILLKSYFTKNEFKILINIFEKDFTNINKKLKINYELSCFDIINL